MKRIFNPWRWQDEQAFVQGVAIPAGSQILYCAGQTSVDAEGVPQHRDDMTAQIMLAFDNLETVLNAAGTNLSNVIGLRYFVTDMDAFFRGQPEANARINAAHCQAVSTLVGVKQLFHGDIMFEVEAEALVP